jgi:hypothetical protein
LVLPLTYHAFHDIALPVGTEETPRNNRAQEGACLALAIGIDCSVIDRGAGLEPVAQSPGAFQQWIASEAKRWAQTVKDARLQTE